MSRILLDTSAYSALREGHAEIERVVAEAEEVYLSSVVLGELHAGFRGGSRRRINEAQLQAFMDLPDVKVAVVTEETALRYAEIINFLRASGMPIPTNDAWVAAGAMEHGLRLLSTDAHFQRLPQVSVICYPRMP